MVDNVISFLEYRLPDPGLVENSRTAEHCVHACFQMIFRTQTGGFVPSFAELDRIMCKIPGKYTWEHNLIAEMPSHGFDVKIIWLFDLDGLADDPNAALLAHYGPEVGQETINNSELETVAEGARRLLESSVSVEKRSPTFEDIIRFITDGFYILVTVNQRVLQADPGYVAHNILLFGYSSRGVVIHNPGPPATCNSEITWDMFHKAWAFPDDRARNIMAFRPNRRE